MIHEMHEYGVIPTVRQWAIMRSCDLARWLPRWLKVAVIVTVTVDTAERMPMYVLCQDSQGRQLPTEELVKTVLGRWR